MGIDPGAANLGFGIVRVEGNRMVALDGGVVETTAELPMERRLEKIHGSLAELIAWHEPKAMAIEDVFFGKNVRTAMVVGQASGVAMLAAAQAGVGCSAYAFVFTWIMLKVIDQITPVRVGEADEGSLDELMHGESAYPNPPMIGSSALF